MLFSVTLVTGLGVTFLNYYDGKQTIHKFSNQIFGETSAKIFYLVKNNFEKAAQIGILNEKIARNFLSNDEELRDFFYKTLEIFPSFTYMSVANEKGSFIGADRITRKLRVRHWEMVGEKKSRMREYDALYEQDKKSYRLTSVKENTSNYDPRIRPWYQDVKTAATPIWLDPFVWANENVPGITFGVPSFNKKGVVDKVFTVDILLDFISKALRDFYPYKSGIIFIVNEQGGIVAHGWPDFINDMKAGDTALPNAQNIRHEQTKIAFSKWMKSERKRNFTYSFENQNFVVKAHALNISENISWHILMSVSENEILASALNSLYRSIGLSLVILVLMIFFSVLVGRYLSNHFNEVFEEMSNIFTFSLEPTEHKSSYIYEIDKIADYLSNIKLSLKSFKKYVSPTLVKKYLLEGVEARLGGHEKEVTVMFIDIEDYSKLSESLDVKDLYKLINQFSMAMVRNVDQFSGTVDKFIGDSIMVFWGGIQTFENEALLACQCAIKCCEDIKKLGLNINIRIGINTGMAVVGNFGSHERFNFTVLGDSVNQASRLEGTNKTYKTNIIINESTYLKIKDKIQMRKIGKVILKGRKSSNTIYEIANFKNENRQRVKSLYESALSEYQSQNWDSALKYLDDALKIESDDGPSLHLIQCCKHYKKKSPPQDWEGILI